MSRSYKLRTFKLLSLPSSFRLWAALVISLVPPWSWPWSLLLKYKIRMILRRRSQATWNTKKGRSQPNCDARHVWHWIKSKPALGPGLWTRLTWHASLNKQTNKAKSQYNQSYKYNKEYQLWYIKLFVLQYTQKTQMYKKLLLGTNHSFNHK